MFQHSHAGDGVELSFHIAVILETDFHRQALAMRFGVVFLLLRDGDAHDLTAVVLCGEFRQPAPAAADVQQAHARLEGEFFADEFHLEFLRRGEVGGVAEISARILHRRIQHRSEKIIPEVVVLMGDDPGARFALEVQQKRECHFHQRAETRADGCFDAAVDRPGAQLLDIVAVPPALHVGLAKTQRAILENAAVEAVVMHLDVARPVAVDFDIRPGEQLGHHALCACGALFAGMDDGDLGRGGSGGCGLRAHGRLSP